MRVVFIMYDILHVNSTLLKSQNCVTYIACMRFFTSRYLSLHQLNLKYFQELFWKTNSISLKHSHAIHSYGMEDTPYEFWKGH